MARIKFIKNAAPIGYGYAINDVADFSDAQAAEFIERGFAEATDVNPETEEVKTATAAKPAAVKKAVKK